MNNYVRSCLVLALVLIGVVATAQARQRLNPPYLNDMPPAARVKSAIKGADPMDTAARISGVFAQLREIIFSVALSQKRDRDHLLPDEKRIADALYADSYYALEPFEKELQKTPEGKVRLFKLYGYQTDPAMREEAFKLSPALRAPYDAAEAFLDARHRTFVQAQSAPDPPAAPAKAAGDDAVARCIAAGRNALDCTAQAMSQGFSELLGVVNPSAANAVPTGLRLNGKYVGGGGFSLAFNNETVAVTCGRLIPEAHMYSVEQSGAEMVVTVQAAPKPLVFKYRQDRSIQGPPAVTVSGQIVTGTRVFTRHYADGRVEPMAETVTAPFTSACGAGVMPSGGVVEVLKGANMPMLGAMAQQTSDARVFTAVAGLRMHGVFSGATGLSLEFSPDQSAVVQCRQALIARDYVVDWKPSGIVVTVQHGTQPLTFSVRPDGSLSGSGSVAVTGRVVTGLAETAVQFRTATDTCAAGLLTPAKR